MAYKRGWRSNEQVEEEDAEPIKQMAVAAITLAEDMRTAMAFGEEELPRKWREFMRVFSMLYGVTKPFIDVKIRQDVDDFMTRWLTYGTAVQQYKRMKDAEATGEPIEGVGGLLDEVNRLFAEVNPQSSLDMFDRYVEVLHSRGMYALKETVEGYEGFEDGDAGEPGQP